MQRLLNQIARRTSHVTLPRCRSFSSTTRAAGDQSLRTALFFPGHGVQRIGMTTPWLEAFPSTAKPFLEETDSILGYSLSSIIENGPNSAINSTSNSQPAIMATSVMITRILEKEFSFDIPSHIDVALGHSLGEYAALVTAGYLTYPSALRMVRRRAEIFEQCSRSAHESTGDTYGMVALVCEPERLDSLITSIHDFLGYDNSGAKDDSSYIPPIEQVLIANINSKNQIVLSGSLQRIKQLLTQIRGYGGHDPRAVEIKCDSPFHSPIMKPAADYMRKALSPPPPGSKDPDPIRFPADMPCISNVTALPFASRADLQESLSSQAVRTVRWWDSIKYLHHEKGVKRWLGVGPGKVGRNLVGKEVGRVNSRGGGVWAITNPEEVEATLKEFLETEKKGD